VGAAVKLAYELSVFRHLGDSRHSISKRTALLLTGALGSLARARFCCGVLGGLALPAFGLLLARQRPPSGASFPLSWLALVSVLAFGLSLCGELLERYFFFAAAPASKMPGSITS
jgi:hypothetical protein